MEEKLLTVNEVLLLVDISYNTLNNWYKFKRENPDNEYAKNIPDCVRVGKKSKRLWKTSDVWQLIKFKESIKHGRAGLMGSVTQRYVKKEVGNEQTAGVE